MSIVEKFMTMEYGPAPEDPREALAWLDRHSRRFGHFINGTWQAPAAGTYFTSGRICRVEIRSCRRRLPSAVYEMSETPAVTVQPRESLTGIFRCGAVLHGHKFFDDAHSFLPTPVNGP